MGVIVVHFRLSTTAGLAQLWDLLMSQGWIPVSCCHNTHPQSGTYEAMTKGMG